MFLAKKYVFVNMAIKIKIIMTTFAQTYKANIQTIIFTSVKQTLMFYSIESTLKILYNRRYFIYLKKAILQL